MESGGVCLRGRFPAAASWRLASQANPAGGTPLAVWSLREGGREGEGERDATVMESPAAHPDTETAASPWPRTGPRYSTLSHEEAAVRRRHHRRRLGQSRRHRVTAMMLQAYQRGGQGGPW
jgi:hypothetical protein